MTKMILAAVLAVAVAGSVQAQDAAPAAKAKKAPNPNKKICRQVETTGSILPSSTCHTAAEWTAIDAQQAADTQRSMDQRRSMAGATAR